MTFELSIFWLFALMAVLPALGILLCRSIVRMAFLLLFSLSGFAGLYLHLGAAFVGFTQVLVYIGGILILFLFGVMLTARTDYPLRGTAPPGIAASGAVGGIIAGLLVTGALAYVALCVPWGVREAPAAVGSETQRIGFDLLGSYVLPFEAVSVLLLVAMIGATYIARGGSGVPGSGEPRNPRDGG